VIDPGLERGTDRSIGFVLAHLRERRAPVDEDAAHVAEPAKSTCLHRAILPACDYRDHSDNEV
jgi:hypothetical protein